MAYLTTKEEENIIRHIERKSLKRLGNLSKEIVLAESKDKEEMMAGIEFERELTGLCKMSLEK